MHKALLVITEPRQAALLTDPVKTRILERLSVPATTAELAKLMDMPRQRLGYHVRQLEQAGLVETVAETWRGNCVGRKLRSVAKRFVVAPAENDNETDIMQSRFSSARRVVQCARTIREIGQLAGDETEAARKLSSLALDTEVAFDNSDDQQAFSIELNEMLAALVARYDSASSGARRFRLVAAAYPKPTGERIAREKGQTKH